MVDMGLLVVTGYYGLRVGGPSHRRALSAVSRPTPVGPEGRGGSGIVETKKKGRGARQNLDVGKYVTGIRTVCMCTTVIAAFFHLGPHEKKVSPLPSSLLNLE